MGTTSDLAINPEPGATRLRTEISGPQNNGLVTYFRSCPCLMLFQTAGLAAPGSGVVCARQLHKGKLGKAGNGSAEGGPAWMLFFYIIPRQVFTAMNFRAEAIFIRLGYCG